MTGHLLIRDFLWSNFTGTDYNIFLLPFSFVQLVQLYYNRSRGFLLLFSCLLVCRIGLMIIGEFDNSCEIVMRLGITAGSGQCEELLPSETEIVNITNCPIGTPSVSAMLGKAQLY